MGKIFTVMVLWGLATLFAWLFYSMLIDTKGSAGFIDSDKVAYRKGIGTIVEKQVTQAQYGLKFTYPEESNSYQGVLLVSRKEFDKAQVGDKIPIFYGIQFPRRWMPVKRRSVRGFLNELRKRYDNLAESSLFSCLGILNKVLEFEALETLGRRMFDWPTQAGIAALPDRPAPQFPTGNEVMSWKEIPSWHNLMPMITYITKKQAVTEAYEGLFGCGGTVLYTSAHEEQKLFAKTKEIFGYRITNEFLQLMNCLPVLGINALLDATDNQFRALYSAVGLYIGESMQDAGVIIISDKKLDTEISALAYMLPRE